MTDGGLSGFMNRKSMATAAGKGPDSPAKTSVAPKRADLGKIATAVADKARAARKGPASNNKLGRGKVTIRKSGSRK